jgi:hypothetical protein
VNIFIEIAIDIISSILPSLIMSFIIFTLFLILYIHILSFILKDRSVFQKIAKIIIFYNCIYIYLPVFFLFFALGFLSRETITHERGSIFEREWPIILGSLLNCCIYVIGGILSTLKSGIIVKVGVFFGWMSVLLFTLLNFWLAYTSFPVKWAFQILIEVL